MAEGSFPKSDGDILYASEVNEFSRNDCKGVLPVATGFTVDPTDLANTTDEDAASVTGTGTLVDTNDTAELTWDLGANIVHNTISIKYDWTCTVGGTSYTIKLAVSEDDSTYVQVPSLSLTSTESSTTVNEGLVLPPTMSKFRYIRLTIEDTVGNATLTVAVYEVMTG